MILLNLIVEIMKEKKDETMVIENKVKVEIDLKVEIDYCFNLYCNL